MALGSPLTVRDALGLRQLRRGLPEVLEGHDGLDRPIRWVHSGEAPNIATLLGGGELLLTTGMGLGESARDQRAFTLALVKRKIAALVIELGTVHEEVPPAVLEVARANDLPVVVLRRPVPFVAVTEAIHTRLVAADCAVLRRAEGIHRRLTALMLDGDGVPAVLAAVAETLRGAVFLESGDDRLLMHAAPGVQDVDPMTVREALRSPSPGEPWRNAWQVEVPMRRQLPGRLVFVSQDEPADPATKLVLQHAAGIVALALLRLRQEEELIAAERGSFLSDLADLRLTVEIAERRAQSLGFRCEPSRLLPIAAELRMHGPETTPDLTPLLREAERSLDGRGISALLGPATEREGVLALIALRAGSQRTWAADTASDALRDALRRRLGAGDMAVAVGSVCDWSACGAGLRLANECAASAIVLPPKPWHDVSALELPRLFWRWRQDDELSAFVVRALGPLVEHDRSRKLRLLPTLEMLVNHGGRKAETARALHLNRQALYHRVGRIEQLLGVDLSNAEHLHALHVALAARTQQAP